MSDRPRLSRDDNRARWRALVVRYRHSSLSQHQFCLEHEVSLSSFTRWRRLFANESVVEHGVPERAALGDFVPVRVQPAPPMPSSSLSVTLSNGVRIENVDLASVPLVAALVRAL